jgi:hypothetical protein
VTGLEVALADLMDPVPRADGVRAALRRGLEGALNATFVPGALTEQEGSEAERLTAKRYGVGCLD